MYTADKFVHVYTEAFYYNILIPYLKSAHGAVHRPICYRVFVWPRTVQYEMWGGVNFPNTSPNIDWLYFWTGWCTVWRSAARTVRVRVWVSIPSRKTRSGRRCGWPDSTGSSLLWKLRQSCARNISRVTVFLLIQPSTSLWVSNQVVYDWKNLLSRPSSREPTRFIKARTQNAVWLGRKYLCSWWKLMREGPWSLRLWEQTRQQVPTVYLRMSKLRLFQHKLILYMYV